MMTFVESPAFTSAWEACCDDHDLRMLHASLAARPTAGAPIPGCPALRKLRFRSTALGTGTQGGMRIIYMHTPKAARIDLLLAYPKGRKADLTRAELAALCTRARQLRRILRGTP